MMDNQSIDEIPAGREMDALVAERVMGLIKGKDWHWPCSDEMFCDRPCPHYSTDIAAAWEVVEYFRRRGIYIYSFGNGVLTYGCTFAMPNHDWNPRWNGVGDTASLAICRAALRVVGYAS